MFSSLPKSSTSSNVRNWSDIRWPRRKGFVCFFPKKKNHQSTRTSLPLTRVNFSPTILQVTKTLGSYISPGGEKAVDVGWVLGANYKRDPWLRAAALLILFSRRGIPLHLFPLDLRLILGVPRLKFTTSNTKSRIISLDLGNLSPRVRCWLSPKGMLGAGALSGHRLPGSGTVPRSSRQRRKEGKKERKNHNFADSTKSRPCPT